MIDKIALADDLRRREEPSAYRKRCVVGFDGFTDEIISVVDKRYDSFSYDRITHMASFGQRIIDAAGKSCNIELVTVKKKIGGNGPIMTAALLEWGHAITLIGAVGTPGHVEELFAPMAKRCERVIPLCPSGHTHALEFDDGKVILGKMGEVLGVSYEELLWQVPKDEIIAIFDAADLFASVNWTMLPMITDLWQRFYEDIVPQLSIRQPDQQRWMFVDLTDPRKRSDEDLAQALQVLQQLSSTYRVALGLNLAEALRVAQVLGIEGHGTTPASLQALAERIASATSLAHTVIHVTDGAAIATEEGCHYVKGPYFPQPRYTTGGGDNFNGGYCNGLLKGYSSEETLLLAVATSGYYVSHGVSPSVEALATFLTDWAEGKLPVFEGQSPRIAEPLKGKD